MVSFKLSILSLAIIIASANAAPTDVPALVERAVKPIANGTQMVEGDLPNWGFYFRTSGFLSKDCNGPRSIKTCYQQKLPKDPKKIDVGYSGIEPLQTNFFKTPSNPANGTVSAFSFRYQLDPSIVRSGGTDLVPITELITWDPIDSRQRAANVYTAVKGQEFGVWAFSDNKPVKTIPLRNFVGLTLVHHWTVKGGPNGGYAEVDIKNLAGKSIFKYRANGQNSKNAYWFRLGTIRPAKKLSPYIAYIGDWTAKVVSN